MRKAIDVLIAALIVALCCSTVKAQQPTFEQRLAALEAGRVATDQKIDELVAEVRALRTEIRSIPPNNTATPPVSSAPATSNYDKMNTAWLQAVRERKPLIVWTGAEICPGCVASTTKSGEWVNLVMPALSLDNGTWPPPDSIQVLRPTSDPNRMTILGTLTGDLGSVADGRGHLWSIRQVLNPPVVQQAVSIMQYGGAPAMAQYFRGATRSC